MGEISSVLVTGASSGIGEAAALHLDGLGWRVFAGVRREADAEALRARGSERLVPLLLDVTDGAAIAAAAKEIEASVAADGLQGLVNNAGVSVPGVLEFQEIDEFRRQLEVNVVAQLAVTQAFLPLIRVGRGRIVNIGSMGGYVSNVMIGAYCSSKFALEAVTDALRRELLPSGIHCAIVEPGSIATKIWEKGEEAAPEIRARMPERALELYDEMVTITLKRVQETAARGIDPVHVAKAVHHALSASRPRTRYRVGTDARVVRLLTWLLPDRAMDWVLFKLYGYDALLRRS